ncbi:hypothetical protein [Gordonia tangerina]|uniref:Uncharacterized protein n=1 Tax=Gordonia tangerina TaxID=2911060 RepID=A0ABS9DNJ8_9ACTN|nr:hypothetical protein [Gordonia tangerina]MCF3940678.1 hypothetical protein [Gordonia tangerina]
MNDAAHGGDPRTALRRMVSDLAAVAGRGAHCPSTCAELRAAAAALNNSDPRFWGGADGVDPAVVADLIAASLAHQLRTDAIANPEVGRYVAAGRRYFADLAAQYRQLATA